MRSALGFSHFTYFILQVCFIAHKPEDSRERVPPGKPSSSP